MRSIVDDVKGVVRDVLGTNGSDIELESQLIGDLGANAKQVFRIISDLRTKLGVEVIPNKRIRTLVGDRAFLEVIDVGYLVSCIHDETTHEPGLRILPDLEEGRSS
jgi:acyl carrier protein